MLLVRVNLAPITGSWDLALTGIHIKPAEAVSEIKFLNDVYQDLRNTWPSVQV